MNEVAYPECYLLAHSSYTLSFGDHSCNGEQAWVSVTTALSTSQMSCAPTEKELKELEAVVGTAGLGIQSPCSCITVEQFCCGGNTFVILTREVNELYLYFLWKKQQHCFTCGIWISFSELIWLPAAFETGNRASLVLYVEYFTVVRNM